MYYMYNTHALHVYDMYMLQAEKERRRQEQIDKKVETRKLLEIEESSLKGKTSHEPKVTRAQIASHVSSSGATPLSKGATPLTTEDDDSLPENPNLLMRERELEGHHDADTIDDAIRILRGDDTAIERHPERRMKAAYSAFEERELPRLKSENPTLRLSQVKQLLRKEWMKSPENPMNQSHTTYRDKT